MVTANEKAPSSFTRPTLTVTDVPSSVMPTPRAAAFSEEWKQPAYPAANSCSGLVAPPGPPCSLGVARSTSIIPSEVRLWPLRPSPVEMASVR